MSGHRSFTMWEIAVVDGKVEFNGPQQLCYLCGGRYVPWKAQKLRFDSRRAVDMEFVCERCGLEAVFGVAVSNEEYDLIPAMELICR